jgi:hypothetical protein
MRWTEDSTRQYLDKHGIAYHTYMALGMGATCEEQEANLHPVLDPPYTPKRCLLRYGEIGDEAPDSFDGWQRVDYTLVARLGAYAILQHENVLELVTPDGSPIEAQIGGTLEQFLDTLKAWQSMATRLYPQNPFAKGY